MSGIVWSGDLYGRSKNQRNWGKKSSWRFSDQYHHLVVKGFCETGVHFYPRCITYCLVGHAQMVGELSLPGKYSMVCFHCIRIFGYYDCTLHGKLPGDQGGHDESSEKH